MTEKTIKFKRGENIQLSRHFHLKEFECKCGKCKETIVSAEHLRLLQELREHFDSPVLISSAYRCPAHNIAVGGVTSSQHPKGLATDITVAGVSVKEVWEYCDKIFDGLGKYKNFNHIDSRGEKARWTGSY